MHSALPKALHTILGLPLAEYVGRGMRQSGVDRPIVVVGHGADQVRETLGQDYDYAIQSQQLGTGDALKAGLSKVPVGTTSVLVAPGDAPLVIPEVFEKMIEAQHSYNAGCVMATCVLDNPYGYGRIIRDSSGKVKGIVEERDATEEQKKIREVCTSFYCFSLYAIEKHLPKLTNDNIQGEYYLTDIVSIMSQNNEKVICIEFEASLLQGVNDRVQLAEAMDALRKRILIEHCRRGVSIMDFNTVWIGPDVEIGEESTISAMCILEGDTKVGRSCQIGAFCKISDTTIGDESAVLMSHISGANIGRRVRIGPFANVRPGTFVSEDVRIGNFVEVKNSTIAAAASVSHLSYIGDASIGERTNIGAGTITCNYDGYTKHPTVIGSDAFIGSNSTLVAPLEIGDGAITAAGSTITNDVPPDALGVGRNRQINKEGWAKRWREKKSKKSSQD
jgi:bifunctional UDP-N-acetylglucosamine pyrophosphorylase/glucosamine-1-phosphate N-acetyltransferase